MRKKALAVSEHGREDGEGVVGGWDGRDAEATPTGGKRPRAEGGVGGNWLIRGTKAK